MRREHWRDSGPLWALRKYLDVDTQNIPIHKSLPYLIKCLPFLKPYTLRFIIGASLSFFQNITSLLQVVVFAFIIDYIIPHGSDAYRLLFFIMTGYFGVMVVNSIVGAINTYNFSYITNHIFHDFRSRIFRHIQRLHINYFESRNTGEIMSRMTNDVRAMSNILSSNLISFVTIITQFFAVSLLMYIVHPQITLFCIATVPFLALPFLFMKNKVKAVQKKSQIKTASMFGALQERISNIMLTKSFGRENHDAEIFENASEATIDPIVQSTFIMSISDMFVGIIGFLGPAVALVYGAIAILNNELTVGKYFVINLWAIRMMGPAKNLVSFCFGIQLSLGAAERVFDLLETPIEREGKKTSKPLLTNVEGSICFENVTFGYNMMSKVLDGINMTINAGEAIAITGLTGAGKSTLVKLLLGFYSPQKGRICIDGKDITEVDLGSLRQSIGLISQETLLFNATFEENILYGKPDANKVEVINAAKAACIHDYIRNLPKGYDTIVGERGLKLSGGQRQLIAIARTFIKNPQIIVIDEATSSLDYKTESAILSSLCELMKNRTSILITHRLNIMQGIKIIYVMDKGKIVEFGSHDELIRMEYGLYNRLLKMHTMKRSNE